MPESRSKWTLNSRQTKTSCPVCGYTARVSRKWLAVRLLQCPCCNIQMLPERPDLFIDHRNRGDRTLASCVKGRPHGSKKTTAVAQGDKIVKLNVSDKA